MPVQELKSLAEFQEVINSGKVVLIDFFAEWCGPCKVISPAFETLSDKVSEVEFYKVNVDNVPDVATECSIRAMPTFQLYQNGEKKGEMLGAKKDQLEAFVNGGVALA